MILINATAVFCHQTTLHTKLVKVTYQTINQKTCLIRAAAAATWRWVACVFFKLSDCWFMIPRDLRQPISQVCIHRKWFKKKRLMTAEEIKSWSNKKISPKCPNRVTEPALLKPCWQHCLFASRSSHNKGPIWAFLRAILADALTTRAITRNTRGHYRLSPQVRFGASCNVVAGKFDALGACEQQLATLDCVI